MTQSETIYFINKKSNTNLIEHKYEFNSYDAYDSNYIVEIKKRRANHKDPFLEVNKTLINLKLAKNQNKQSLYVQQDDTGIYVFNISKLNLNRIYKRFYNVPETTYVGKNKRVDKEFWVLNKSLSTKLELCTKEN